MFLTEPPPSAPVEAAYAADRADDGYVNNFTKLWSWRPDVNESFTRARSMLVQESDLAPADVALLFAATAAARSDSYCSLHWGAAFAGHADAETASNLLAGSVDGLDDRSAALADWARRVATDPNSTTQADVERLRALGLTDKQILEATLLIAVRLAFTTVNDALGAQPDAQLATGVPAAVRAAVGFGRPPAQSPSV